MKRALGSHGKDDTSGICSIYQHFCIALWVSTNVFYLCVCVCVRVHVCLAYACIFVWKRTFMNVYVGSGCWSSLYTGLYKVQVFSVRPWFLSPHPKGFKRLTFLLDLSLRTLARGRLCISLTYCSHQLTDFFYCFGMILQNFISQHSKPRCTFSMNIATIAIKYVCCPWCKSQTAQHAMCNISVTSSAVSMLYREKEWWLEK